MKAVSSGFKTAIKTFGRELSSLVTYTIGETEYTLTNEQLNAITLRNNADLLKTIMKQVEIDSNTQIPLETIINIKFGVKVSGTYEYIDYGNYTVKENSYNADTLSYIIKGYDNMIESMIDYDLLLTYPLTVKELAEEICSRLGWGLENSTFINSTININTDVLSGINYTFRDVLDEIAQITGSNIIINANGNLELIYFNDTEEIIDEASLKDVNITINKMYGPINALVFSRSADSDTINLRDETSITANGLCEIKISENQFLSTDDRSDFITDLFTYLDGKSFYLNDYESPGITYLELADLYTIKIGDNEYPTLMMNDEISITQGLSEKIYIDEPEITETDYRASSSTDKLLNKTVLLVDKQEQTITAVVSQTTAIQTDLINVQEQTSTNSDNIDVLTNANESTQTELSQIQIDINSIKNTVQEQGGANMIENSCMLYGTGLHTITDTQGTAGSIISGKITDLVGKTISEGGYIIQNKKVQHDVIKGFVIGKTYTMTFKYSNQELNNLLVVLHNLDEETVLDTSVSATLEEVAYTFVAKSNEIYYYIQSDYADDNLIALITDIIIKSSDVRTDWEPAKGEILGTNVVIYYNGIEISSPDEEFITKINNLGFVVTNYNNEVVLQCTKDGIITSNITINGKIFQGNFIVQTLTINSDLHWLVS